MLKYYYILWVDAVTSIKKKGKDETILLSLSSITSAMICNLLTLSFILDFLGLKINFMALGYHLLLLFGVNKGKLGGALTALVILLFNYFTIFRNNKIERLIEKYPSYNGKIFIPYILLSILVPMLVLVIWFVYAKYLQ